MRYTPLETPSSKPATERRQRLLAIGVALLTLVGIVVAALRPAWLTGSLQAAVENAGVAAPVVFVLLCALAVPLHLNGVLVALSSLLWPLPIAGALSFTGSLLGSVLTAALLSRVGGTALHQQAGWPAWLRRLATQVTRRPLLIGLVARAVVGSGMALEAFFLFAGYTWRQYLVVTLIGIVVWVTQALVGVTLLHAAVRVSAWLAIVFVILPILLVAVLLVLYRNHRRSQ